MSVIEKIAAEQNTHTKYWGQCGEDTEQDGKERGGGKADLANLKLSFLLQEKTLQHVPAN